MRRSILLLACALNVFALGLSTSTTAAAAPSEPSALVADLEGSAIPPGDVGRYFCHDFEFPRIRCFSTAFALEEALARDSSQDDSTTLAAYAAGDYLTVYSEPSYAGAYAHLSQNYDALWVIGWNDRIRSFKVRDSASGAFYTDWYAGGQRYEFCCNNAVPILSSAYDRAFSSVYRW